MAYAYHISFIQVGQLFAILDLQGSNLDSNAKMWRLVADLMNDLGTSLLFTHTHTEHICAAHVHKPTHA